MARPPITKPIADRITVLQRGTHIFNDGHVRKHRRDLKRADNAAPRGLRGLFSRDVDTVEQNGAGGRLQKFAQQVEEDGFAGPVRADQGMDMPALHTQIHRADGGKTAKLLGQLAGFENGVIHRLHGLGQNAARSRSAPFSATITVAPLVLPETMRGMMDASIT